MAFFGAICAIFCCRLFSHSAMPWPTFFSCSCAAAVEQHIPITMMRANNFLYMAPPYLDIVMQASRCMIHENGPMPGLSLHPGSCIKVSLHHPQARGEIGVLPRHPGIDRCRVLKQLLCFLFFARLRRNACQVHHDPRLFRRGLEGGLVRLARVVEPALQEADVPDVVERQGVGLFHSQYLLELFKRLGK